MSEPAAPTFLGLPRAEPREAKEAGIAVFGASYGTPYEAGKVSHSADAPGAIRIASSRDAPRRDHYDFDWGGALDRNSVSGLVDCGDVPGAPGTPQANRENITSWTKALLEASAVPVLLGGDDSVPIPFVAAFADAEPVWVVQVDAHLDWRDERHGERYGWSSPMRRISEMAHVQGMVQVGLRGVGTARAQEVNDARDWGSRLITAADVHMEGIEKAIGHIPEGANVIVTFDCDALDPSIMPGVLSRVPGGLTYTQAISLLHGIARRGKIVGFDLVELIPERDVDGLSALTAYRIVANAVAAISRGR